MASQLEVIFADDERHIRSSIGNLLIEAGYNVRIAKNGEEALAKYAQKRPDLMLLDVKMPKKDGYEVCREIRANDEKLPIIFLTACNSEADELKGLGVGADSYIFKTASNELLLARISAALRLSQAKSDNATFDFNGVKVDPAAMQLKTRSGKIVDVREREIMILRFFAEHPNEVFNRDFLLTRFWGVNSDYTDNLLSVEMWKLRQLLGKAGDAIVAIRAVGYVYRK